MMVLACFTKLCIIAVHNHAAFQDIGCMGHCMFYSVYRLDTLLEMPIFANK
ncbi:MAG: hypothetical protein GY765_19915 [bacterium]|nr:hypothetical protein [bacterium]